jgi:hypothetical protein
MILVSSIRSSVRACDCELDPVRGGVIKAGTISSSSLTTTRFSASPIGNKLPMAAKGVLLRAVPARSSACPPPDTRQNRADAPTQFLFIFVPLRSMYSDWSGPMLCQETRVWGLQGRILGLLARPLLRTRLREKNTTAATLADYHRGLPSSPLLSKLTTGPITRLQ